MAFVMGFSFGLIIWWPVAFGSHENGPTFMSEHFITVVSVYAVLLLSDVLFYNAFGFDRAAAQLYFVVPVATRTVILAKNITAMFFVTVETAIATLICAALGLPFDAAAVTEAYCVTVVATLMLLSLGNFTSFYSPRSSDPGKTFRSGRGNRVQAVMVLIFPVITIPVAVAFLARYALRSELAFYLALSCGFALAAILHRVSLDIAVRRSETHREAFLSALSGGEGLIEA
jgi:ABC-2 type transport system permease protein